MGVSSKKVLDFLERFKRKADQEGIHFQDRKRNLDSLANLGLSIEDAEEIILGLTEEEYVTGPEKDLDGSSGEIWVFGSSYGGRRLYIKVKLDNIRSKCISFHEADHPLIYPLKKGR
jgi:hypothetical protein